MRRILFGDGFPRRAPYNALPVANFDSTLQVLDLRNAPAESLQSTHVHVVTLYAYIVEALTDDVGINVYCQYGAETPFIIQRIVGDNQAAGVSPAPVKLLDKVPFRGQFRIMVNVDTNEDAHVRVFGYYEFDGEEKPLQELRALQASNTLSAPFNAGPQKLTVTPDVPATIQLLNAGYTDEITLSYSAQNGDEFSAIPDISLGAESFPLNDYVGSSPASRWMTIFDGIPMRSASPLQVTTAASSFSYVGSFKRN